MAKIQAEAKDWHWALALSPAGGRQILRRVLSSPIYVKLDDHGRWHYRCTGHLGNLLRGWFAIVQVSEADVDAANAAAEAEVQADQGVTDVTTVGEPCGTRTRDSLLKEATPSVLSTPQTTQTRNNNGEHE